MSRVKWDIYYFCIIPLNERFIVIDNLLKSMKSTTQNSLNVNEQRNEAVEKKNKPQKLICYCESQKSLECPSART